MSTDLTIARPVLPVLGETDLQKGGLGIDFTSKLADVQPATLTIVQNMSDVVSKGVPPGKLYIKDVDKVYDSLRAVLLKFPHEQRDYYEGEQRTIDTRMCFSRDNIRPDDRAVAVQAMTCAGCRHNNAVNENWAQWRNSPLPNPQKRHLIPKCDSSYYIVLMDAEYRLPLQMWVKGASKDNFEAGMKNIMRQVYMLQAQGQNPNIFDIAFTLTSEPGKQKNHVLKMTNIKQINDAERLQFGEMYLKYVNRAAVAQQKQLAAAAQVEATADVEVELSSPTTDGGAVDGEYVSI